jgi:putative transposase
MRTARLITPGKSYYHCMSRVVDGRFIFGDEEKYYFRKVMRGLEHFMGVRVVTYCVMSNHFHVLVETPEEAAIVPAGEVTDAELVKLVRPLYGSEAAKQLEMELANCDEYRFHQKKENLRLSYLNRRGRLDLFMKDLKQRFTQWYNRKEGRRGTLWEDRYKSVLVGNSDDAILTMAAYIDLNPVRAGIVRDPADFKYSGYGEACGGGGLARSGLAVALERPGKSVDWVSVGAEYRKLLYGVGGERGLTESGKAKRKGFSREEVLASIAAGGVLPLWKTLRCRVRYLSDGAVFGTREFVEGVFESNRDRFGKKRESGSRAMDGGEWGELRVLRNLRQQVFG